MNTYVDIVRCNRIWLVTTRGMDTTWHQLCWVGRRVLHWWQRSLIINAYKYVPITAFFIPCNVRLGPKLRSTSLGPPPRDRIMFFRAKTCHRRKGSIHGLSDRKSDALPTELFWQIPEKVKTFWKSCISFDALIKYFLYLKNLLINLLAPN